MIPAGASPSVSGSSLLGSPPRHTMIRPAAALGHRAEDELRREHHGPQVQVERVIPFRRVRRGEARPFDASGVVDQYADRARGVYGRADAGVGGDIRADERPADPGGGGRTGLIVEIGDEHAHAFRREPLGDSGAYPVRTPCHQRGGALKVHGGIVRRGTDNSAEQVRMTLRERSRR